MEKTIKLFVLFFVAIAGHLCLAQTNSMQKASVWGGGVHGVRLSIAMTNNVFKVGSTSTCEAAIENSSTNDISLIISAVNFRVLLTSITGKSYNIIKPIVILFPRRLETRKPGEIKNESILLTFGENIEPGDYTLMATRHFSLRGEDFELKSNSIKVQIIK